jgi:hypothetical protein
MVCANGILFMLILIRKEHYILGFLVIMISYMIASIHIKRKYWYKIVLLDKEENKEHIIKIKTTSIEEAESFARELLDTTSSHKFAKMTIKEVKEMSQDEIMKISK